MSEEFVIYRPHVTLKRLDKENKPDEWSPTLHYKHSLDEIGSQQTPAELYRKKLLDLGHESRALRRLEWRWKRNFASFLRASLKVQALYRGFKGRNHFKTIKKQLELLKIQRETKARVVELFKAGEKLQALSAIDEVLIMSPVLYVIKMKIHYILENHVEVEHNAATLLELDEANVDGYYILACSYAARNNYEAAYQQLCLLFTHAENSSEQREHVARLNGLVCTKLKPPKYLEALESFDYLVETYPEDMNSLLQRACCLVAIQEWEWAVKDLTVILDYQPELTHVRNMRARANCCRRKWEWAKQDYERVLKDNPNPDETDPAAQEGLNYILEPNNELQMLDPGFIQALCDDA